MSEEKAESYEVYTTWKDMDLYDIDDSLDKTIIRIGCKWYENP